MAETFEVKDRVKPVDDDVEGTVWRIFTEGTIIKVVVKWDDHMTSTENVKSLIRIT